MISNQSKITMLASWTAMCSVHVVPAHAQSSGYFSEWEDGHVIREIGRDIVEAGCRLDHETVVGIVGHNMENFGPKVEGTPEQYWGIILGNLGARQQVELDQDAKQYVVLGTGECN